MWRHSESARIAFGICSWPKREVRFPVDEERASRYVSGRVVGKQETARRTPTGAQFPFARDPEAVLLQLAEAFACNPVQATISGRTKSPH